MADLPCTARHVLTGALSCHYTFAWLLALRAHTTGTPLPPRLLRSQFARAFLGFESAEYDALGCRSAGGMDEPKKVA
jgi:hypothetical protein